MPAPVASGGSGRRVGLAPTGKRRLVTAHVETGHQIGRQYKTTGNSTIAHFSPRCRDWEPPTLLRSGSSIIRVATVQASSSRRRTTSAPQTSHPLRADRANISNLGTFGYSRSIISANATGLALCWPRGAVINCGAVFLVPEQAHCRACLPAAPRPDPAATNSHALGRV